MVKTELEKKYELVVIVDAKLTNEAKQSILQEVTDTIDKVGGKIINNEVWLEKQKFTAKIKKCLEGTYYLINFSAQRSAIAKIRSILRLNEKILRFVVMIQENS
ncbi:MAG: 30S ribosomal protein S6 [Candidatus Zapsychrus exili]|nr:30S ribosomal protein S6 [Candidatus Zapsychrus exili]